MKSKIRCGSFWRWAALALLVAGFVSVTVLSISAAARSGHEPPQENIRLESRINQLEQRLFTIETNIRTLEQQSRLGAATSREVGPEILALLRSEIQRLQQQLADDECGLAKLDERTLNREMRDARRRAGAGNNDPCRQNVDTPLQLSRR
jgi:hypothetical protein